MDESRSNGMPRARQEELLVHELADEVLVYDLKRRKAHCLNKTAALVWNRCDGETGVSEMARLLEQELGASVDDDVVWLALKQLDRARLLGEAPQHGENSSVSRRQLMRTLGWSAAAALPLVTSILAPSSVSAQSCSAKGATCTSSAQCCAGCNCVGNPLKCAGSCA